MALKLNEVKSNPSSTYPTTAPTLTPRPLALRSEFASGVRLAGLPVDKTKLPSKRNKASTKRPTGVQFRGKPRVIAP